MSLVKVTEELIKNGLPRNPEQCPVALALREALPNRRVVVEAEEIWIEGEGYDMPSHVWEFVNRFDTGKPVVAFEFDTNDLQLIEEDD